MRKSKLRVTKGSGNVFADLGMPNPEQELLKARLTLQIYRIVKERGLTQAQAGELLGIKQPHVSALMRNRAGNFSVGRLMEFLTALGQDIEITVKPTRKAQGKCRWSCGEICSPDERSDIRDRPRGGITKSRIARSLSSGRPLRAGPVGAIRATLALPADQEARSLTRVTLPVPVHALQMIRLPRSRMRPVPQQRTQVSWRTGAGRSLCPENRRFPKSILQYPWVCFAFFAMRKASGTLSPPH